MAAITKQMSYNEISNVLINEKSKYKFLEISKHQFIKSIEGLSYASYANYVGIGRITKLSGRNGMTGF